MKNKILLLLFILSTASLRAQTNLDSVPNLLPNTPASTDWTQLGADILKVTGLSLNPTNYGAGVFVGHSTSGSKWAFGVVVEENINNNVGLIAGVDYLTGGGKIGSANIVAGGLSLKDPLHPLTWGVVAAIVPQNSFTTNLTLTPYGVAMVGTPFASTGAPNGGLASILRTGGNLDLYLWHGWILSGAVDYGSRSGSGNYNGNWIDGLINFRHGF